MKKIYTLIFTLFCTVLSYGQFTETFEAFSDNQNTFTSNGQEFTTGTSNFDVESSFAGFGASGSDVFVDNNSSTATGDINSISTTDGANFTLKDIDIFLSEDDGITVGGSGGLIIRGRENNVTLFTLVISSGIPTDFIPDNGFFNVDFATQGGVDNSNTNIDEVEFELTGNFNYIAIDEFTFGPEAIVADTTPPAVQFIETSGNPPTTSDAVDFTVSFNEDANNVTIDDFELDLTGTVGATLSGFSGSDAVYTLTVTGISGEGTLSIDLKANTDIIDDLGNGNGNNGNTMAFTAGEDHVVSSCFLESFEELSENATAFTSNGIAFVTTANFDVETVVNGGASDSDKFLSNDGMGAGSYTIQTGGDQFTMSSLDVYVSSNASGFPPTNDGTLTIKGKLLDNTELYSIDKSMGFPTDDSVDNGFTNINFATDGMADYSTTNIEVLEITIGGSFVYVSVDHFEFCEAGIADTFEPEVTSIEVAGNPTSVATSVDFTVSFNENVSNVTIDDFALDTTGSVMGMIAVVTPVSGNVYTVTVSDITGFGTVSIDLNSGTDIQDGLMNSGPPAFTAGEAHTLSECFIETFEDFTAGDTSFLSNGVNFTTTNGLDVFDQVGAGVGSSDKFLDNEMVGAGIFSIQSGGDLFTANSVNVFVSSTNMAPIAPTDDGSLIIRGKNATVEVFSVTLNNMNTTFPTSTATNNGFLFVDFSSLLGTDYTEDLIDELEFEITSGFVFLAIDNFEFCLDEVAPTVTITSSESGPTGAIPIPITITFSEEVTGFEASDLVVGNAALSNFNTTDNITFTADLTAVMTGMVTVDIASGVANDASGNGNDEAVQFAIMFDMTLSDNNPSSLENQFSYLNPVKSILNIQTNSNVVIQDITIYALSGRAVLSGFGSSIDISALSTGIYLAKLTTADGQNTVIKILKE